VTGLIHDSDIKNLNFTVDKTLLAHENSIGIKGTGISLLFESLYSEGKTFASSDNQLHPLSGEAVIYSRGRNNMVFDVLFKLGIVFRSLGIICLFIFCFGMDFSRKCVRRYGKEMIASLLFTLLFFLALSTL
jgi:hypothetical protein